MRNARYATTAQPSTTTTHPHQIKSAVTDVPETTVSLAAEQAQPLPPFQAKAGLAQANTVPIATAKRAT